MSKRGRAFIPGAAAAGGAPRRAAAGPARPKWRSSESASASGCQGVGWGGGSEGDAGATSARAGSGCRPREGLVVRGGAPNRGALAPWRRCACAPTLSAGGTAMWARRFDAPTGLKVGEGVREEGGRSAGPASAAQRRPRPAASGQVKSKGETGFVIALH
ncbi:MAG: hypothetical protein J3K34DRAFT_402362 [Monoraphidium minutum]|nr:MAG: hypothetical protein J3K34DRAFT_402362 [Monoraphidium minutum]